MTGKWYRNPVIPCAENENKNKTKVQKGIFITHIFIKEGSGFIAHA
jgi:hypothetical protein